MIVKRLSCIAFAGASIAIAAVGAASAAPGPSVAATDALPDAPATTDRIIVKLRSAYRVRATPGQRVLPMAADRAGALSASAGIALRAVRPMSDDAHVIALPGPMRNDTVQGIVDRLRRDPSVEYAYVDAREHLTATPNDPLFNQQTYLQAPGAAPLVPAVNAPAAWDLTRGSGSAVIAIVDQGVRLDHPDLAGRFVTGYDFVSADCTPGAGGCTAATQFTTANDGDGRDADPNDPGDWVTANDVATNPILTGCDVEESTWHGTHVAGIVGATGGNALGVTGLNWNATMLPVRVSGRCGGYRSDVVDGMRWSVGIAVPNAPANTRPAKIVNVSLGSAGACQTSAYNQAVIDVLATGAVIVAAAGNEDADVILPGNCPGVISVGAVRGDGTRAVYSNTGSGLTIMAPGGDYTSATNDRLASTNNSGRTGPDGYSSAGYYAGLAGTSFSTPVVTGVVSLMLSVNPGMSSAQVIDVLRATARPFVTVAGYATCVAGGGRNASNQTPCNCTTAACGAGYVDANAAVTRAYTLAGGVVGPVTPVTPVTPTPPASSSGGGGGGGGSGGGGGGAVDPASIAVLLLIGVATRRWRRRGPDA